MRSDGGRAGAADDEIASLGADILLMTTFARNCIAFPAPKPRNALEDIFRPAKGYRTYSIGYYEEDVVDDVFEVADDCSTDDNDGRWSGPLLHRPGSTAVLDALAEVCARDPGDVYAVAAAVRSGGDVRVDVADKSSRAATTASSGSGCGGRKKEVQLTLAANRAIDAETRAYVAEITRLMGAISEVKDTIRTKEMNAEAAGANDNIVDQVGK